MAMTHDVLSIVSAASGVENEDHGGSSGTYAWVIDAPETWSKRRSQPHPLSARQGQR